MSTIGLSPVTVIVSSTAPTRSSASMFDVKFGRHLDTVALDGAEPGQRERDGVGSGRQVDDAVLTGAVGHHRSNFFDERRARRFDGHAGQHGPGCVFHGAGDRAEHLRIRHRRDGQDP